MSYIHLPEVAEAGIDPVYKAMIPSEIEEALASIFKIGADKGYEPNSWEGEPILSHVIKGLGHIVKWLRGSAEEDHLLHALWRIAIGVTLLLRLRKQGKVRWINLHVNVHPKPGGDYPPPIV